MEQPIKESAALWRQTRRVVVKVGSALLVDGETGCLRAEWLDALVADVAALKATGREVALVSSGAIALGRNVLGLPRGALKLEESQASAAVGQIALAQAYQAAFARRSLIAAQLLLTFGDTEERRRYLNARQATATLLRLGAVPVVNENDTVATAEIRYGDNDRLAARVASMVSADCLVLLSDIDGLYTAPPAHDPHARHIPFVAAITPEIEAMAGDAGTELSRGGMKTKIMAAKIAIAAGAHMVIASGRVLHPLARLAAGAPATWFVARANPVMARKRWIAGSVEPRGSVVIDAGAAAALAAGRSLLPAGVTAIEGHFQRGDAVVIRDAGGTELGRGLVGYDAREAQRLAGHRSEDAAGLLGYAGKAELIHRDDMALKE